MTGLAFAQSLACAMSLLYSTTRYNRTATASSLGSKLPCCWSCPSQDGKRLLALALALRTPLTQERMTECSSR